MATAYTMSSYHQWDPWMTKQGTLTISGSFTPATLVVSDTFKFFYLPVGITLHSIGLALADMDTHVTPLLTLSVGDSSGATLFISSNTGGQTGTAVTTTTALPKQYTTANYLLMTVSAGAATASLQAVPFFLTLSVDSTTNVL